MAALRRQREREMVRIAWRDLAGSAAVAEILAETSAFADAAIAGGRGLRAHASSSQPTARRAAPPASRSRSSCSAWASSAAASSISPPTSISSSSFPKRARPHGARSIDNEDFFTRLGRLVIRILGERTSEGFVHRVDMRLRPFGDSGPLTVSGAFLDNYLQTHGRDWERYAWIKARAITGARPGS